MSNDGSSAAVEARAAAQARGDRFYSYSRGDTTYLYKINLRSAQKDKLISSRRDLGDGTAKVNSFTGGPRTQAENEARKEALAKQQQAQGFAVANTPLGAAAERQRLASAQGVISSLNASAERSGAGVRYSIFQDESGEIVVGQRRSVPAPTPQTRAPSKDSFGGLAATRTPNNAARPSPFSAFEASVERAQQREKDYFSSPGIRRVEQLSSIVTGGRLNPIGTRSFVGQASEYLARGVFGAVPYTAGAVSKGVDNLALFGRAATIKETRQAIPRELRAGLPAAKQQLKETFNPRTPQGVASIALLGTAVPGARGAGAAASSAASKGVATLKTTTTKIGKAIAYDSKAPLLLKQPFKPLPARPQTTGPVPVTLTKQPFLGVFGKSRTFKSTGDAIVRGSRVANLPEALRAKLPPSQLKQQPKTPPPSPEALQAQKLLFRKERTGRVKDGRLATPEERTAYLATLKKSQAQSRAEAARAFDIRTSRARAKAPVRTALSKAIPKGKKGSLGDYQTTSGGSVLILKNPPKLGTRLRSKPATKFGTSAFLAASIASQSKFSSSLGQRTTPRSITDTGLDQEQPQKPAQDTPQDIIYGQSSSYLQRSAQQQLPAQALIPALTTVTISQLLNPPRTPFPKPSINLPGGGLGGRRGRGATSKQKNRYIPSLAGIERGTKATNTKTTGYSGFEVRGLTKKQLARRNRRSYVF